MASPDVRRTAEPVRSQNGPMATSSNIDSGTTWQSGNRPDTWSPVWDTLVLCPENASVTAVDFEIEVGIKFLVEVTM